MTQRKQPADGPAFELKGTVSTLTVLRLRTTAVDRIRAELAEKIGQLSRFFHHAPVVVDVEPLGESGRELPLGTVAELLRESRLIPVAVRNCPADREPEAVAAGLGVLRGGALVEEQRAPAAVPDPVPTDGGAAAETPARPVAEVADEGQPAPQAVPILGSVGMLVTQPARAGQVIYAQGRDLVIVAPVNAGAEAIADGNIHVYGPLRGRALAGAHGDEKARIFCSCLEAELVSVAGHYLRADEIPEDCRGRAVQVQLVGDELVVVRL